MDLIDIFRTFHPNAEEYTFFSSAHGTFSKIDHILGHKSNLSKFKKTEIISSIFSDYITNYQRNAHQTHSEISPNTSQHGHHQKVYRGYGEGVEKRKHSCTVGGNVNGYSHYGIRYGDSLKTKNQTTM